MKWYIYKDDTSPIGPMTPAEIRDGLREGSIDPFDFVTKEGSSLRLQLIEVDEIFELSKDYEGDHHTVISSEIEVPDESVDAENLTRLGGKEAENEPILGRGQLHLAAKLEKVDPIPSESNPQQKPLDVSIPKEVKRHYFLAIPGKTQQPGPYSATEIAQLFKGKKVPAKIRVIRMNEQNNASGEVPLEKFLNLFDPNHRGISKTKPHVYVNQSTSALAERVREGQRVARDRAIFLSFLSLVMFAVAGLIIGVSVVKKKTESSTRVKEVSKSTLPEKRQSRKNDRAKPQKLAHDEPVPLPQFGNKKKAEELKLKKEKIEKDRAREEKAEREKTEREKAAKVREEKAEKERIELAEKEERERNKKLREELVQAKMKASEMQKKLSMKNERQKQQEPVSPTFSPSPVASPPPPPPPAPPPLPQPGPKANPAPPKASTMALIDGSNANQYGPLSCNKSAVTACDGSCTVTCSGPQGQVSIMFFKSVWGPKIESKSSSVYVSGFVRVEGDGPPRIIVSGVN